MKDSERLWRPTEGWTIGVDFGTAFSKAAATCSTRKGASIVREMAPLHIGAVSGAAGSLVVPSAMFLHNGRVHFGPRAVEQWRIADDDNREMLQSFKTILGANDFETALELRSTRAIDPEGAFRRCDLIVLYLAYLLQLIERAAPAELGALYEAGSGVRLRYSRPGWVPKRADEAYAAMEKLMQAAAQVRLEIGPDLLAGEGLRYQDALDAAWRAMSSETPFPNLDGAIYEASAVAACHFIDPKAPDHLVVVDIGAGTADFAGFIRDGEGASAVEAVRCTIEIAGDVFDRALMNVMMSKARGFKTPKDKSALWRAMLADIREVKETLVATGRAEYRFRNRTIKSRLNEFKAHGDYKGAAEAIASVYAHSLRCMAAEMPRKGSRRIGVVLAGGGAHLPSTIAMAKRTRSLAGGVKVDILPTSPRWASDLNSDREFKALFAQMCVAFGTALSEPNQFKVRTLQSADA